MKQAAKLALALLLLLGASPALADEGVLLLGCVEEADGGSTVVLAESSAPIPLDGYPVLADDLLGQRCAAVLRRLLDNERIVASDIAASSHLVLSAPQRDGSARDAGGDDVCCPDCLIWDLDSAGVYFQLTCDLLGEMTIVGQDSAASGTAPGVLAEFVGMPCAEALAALGGLANLVRSSVGRADQGESSKGRDKITRVSVLTYQLALKLP